jgi:hypothetical protein
LKLQAGWESQSFSAIEFTEIQAQGGWLLLAVVVELFAHEVFC